MESRFTGSEVAMSGVISLKNVECRDCYKCIRKCPVKAIRYSDGRAEIIDSECVLCGECVISCPQGGDFLESDVGAVRRMIGRGVPVVASVSPAFISDIPVGSIEGMRETLRALGFADAQESALGVEIVAREYERIMRENEMDLLISSCCSSVVMLIQRYYPDVLPYLAPVKSPMQIHCQMLKQQYPDALTVFIGPCYAKKGEAAHADCVDYAITFYELREWMREAGVQPVHVARAPEDRKRARRYPRQDGLVKSMTPIEGWNRVAIDGVNDCIAALSEIRHGGIEKTFLEMTACEGSCVNGPAIRKGHYENRIHGTVAVNEYAGNNDFGVTTDLPIRSYYAPEPVQRSRPSEDEIQAVLKKLSKDTPKNTLNCGCCGYTTCRQMAIAICRDMAQMDMCLPYVREKAESHSHEIVDNTLKAADQLIDRQMRVVQNVASILGETTAETKVILTRLKEAIQSDD